jgi:hypothetical protein
MAMNKPRWSTAMSIRASLIVTWIGGAVAIAVAIAMPFAGHDAHLGESGPVVGYRLLVDPTWFRHFLVPFYLCLACGLVALVILSRLLRALVRDEVFTLDNVRRLRAISYCGVAIAVVCVVEGVWLGPWQIAWAVAALAAFMALIVRVIKNVIDAARLIKEDNDFTI